MALLVGGYAVFTLHKLLQAVEDLSTSLSNTVDKLADVEAKLESQHKAVASMTHTAQSSILNVMELIPILLQKNGKSQWAPVALLGFRAFEAYFRKRRSHRNALPQGDVGNDTRAAD